MKDEIKTTGTAGATALHLCNQDVPEAARPAGTPKAQGKIKQALALISEAAKLVEEAGGWLYAVTGAENSSHTTIYGSNEDIATAVMASMRDDKNTRRIVKMGVAMYKIYTEE